MSPLPLSTIAEGLAVSIEVGGSSVDERCSERRYEQILSTATYDAWLIHWPAGTGLDAHDHGGSAGAFAVVAGVLEERVVRRGVESIRRWRAGQSVTFGTDHVHAVSNPGRAVTTSVHVYSPPLRSMEFYDGGERDRLLPAIGESES